MLITGTGAPADLCQSHCSNDDGYNGLCHLSIYLGKLCAVTMVSGSYTVGFFFSLQHISDSEKVVSSLGQRLVLGSMVEHNTW